MSAIPRTPTATAPRIVAVGEDAEAAAAAALAETFTGLTVGQAVIIKSGVVVTRILGLVVCDG